jgi:Ca2+-binding EF-hand superfamily protein
MNPWRFLPIAALAFSAAALAQSQPSAQPSFGTLDANRDGFIARQEALELPLLWAAFHGADRNGDGRLDRQEFDEEMAISMAMRHSGERVFVQEAVLDETASARAMAPRESASAGGSAAPREAASAGASAPREPSPLFRRLDRDRDGFLSGVELESETALRGNWMAMDRDGDGRISAAEFSSLPSR